MKMENWLYKLLELKILLNNYLSIK